MRRFICEHRAAKSQNEHRNPGGRPGGTGTLHIHSTPISRETFQEYDIILGQTFAAIRELGLEENGGPNIWGSVLKRIAMRTKTWETIQNGLFPEIYRQTSVIANVGGSWVALPWAIALARGVMDEDDVAEATGALVFFIVTSAVEKRSKVAEALEAPGRIWGFSTTLSNSTEYTAYLQTLTPVVVSTPKVAESLVPS